MPEAESAGVVTPGWEGTGQFTRRERDLLRTLAALAEQRVTAETETEQWYAESGVSLEEEHTKAVAAARSRRREAEAAERAMHRDASERIRTTASEKHDSTDRSRLIERDSITEKAEQNQRRAKKQLEEALWVTETVYEANENQPEEQFRGVETILGKRRDELLEVAEQARGLLRKYRQRPPSAGAPDEPDPAVDPRERLEASSAVAATELMRLRRLRIARIFRGYLLPFLILVIASGAGVLAAWRAAWQIDQRVAITAGATLAGLVALTALLYVIAKRRARVVYGALAHAVQDGIAACDHCLRAAEQERDRREAEMLEQRDRDVRLAHEKYEPILAEIEQRKAHHLTRIEEKYPKLLEEIAETREQDMAEEQARHEQRTAEIEREHEEESARLAATYEEATTARAERYARERASLEGAWHDGMTRCRDRLEAITDESTRLFPQWSDPAWETWKPPTTFAPSVRYGEIAVDRRAIPGGIPEDQRLAVPGPVEFTLPLTLDFPDRCSLLLLTDGPGRDAAVATLQTVMLRLLTLLPPGKVRFTILDPIGLGENFAGFMHLADYEEQFVASRIWTETRHIEQRLADLTEHMETVIQKYLRNEFETIAEYNVQAGEIAEPYRFLVISDFPANFSDTAARRLASVVSSGARCGVHTLITVDRRLQMPKGIDLADLQAHATTLVCTPTGFEPTDEVYKPWPLTLDAPPPEEFLNRALRQVGEASLDATRVEVPFQVIAPKPKQCWSSECDHVLSVPLGRSGATKLQQLAIGAGTNQHALIAGKTGSGKSTLLHVLVTNLALWYHPDEVQFYLVDFKKGVEFKTYATHDLPHAQAVAVESDREFGLSVLQRVDAELKRRGDLFRDLGVQNLAGYRALGRDEPMPRTLLIIDEFQEIFVEDDKIGQDAALLMDRLVRQGRAFGVHVLLGSQTLGGAYTLPRSTMGQMQVRIALQCSEADSYLIMSDDNAAARLLARPGEAIYNDAGGAIEGNSPFQIVWLPDAERESQLKRVRDLAAKHGYAREKPLIVFEGNASAEVSGNHLLNAALDGPTWAEPDPKKPLRGWLGDAIAIKDPTCAVFRRQSGGNVLLVGQRDEAALAMTETSLVSLAAQRHPDGPRFYILDGTPVDAPNAGALARAAERLPHDVRLVAWREVAPAMDEIAGELARRQDLDATDAPPLFLFIFGLQRFRMLRMADDFGFSMGDDDKPASPERQFADVLRDGPPLGIHTFAWCDTATNLHRTLDRNGLREFETRVLFQMSGADSTQLIDSPLAGRLGLGRALFYNEEAGLLEKFRPYAVPDERWLDSVRERLAAKRTPGAG
jgi:hypothetical protein